MLAKCLGKSDWYHFANHAGTLTQLGIDVSEKVKPYEAELRKHLAEMISADKKGESWSYHVYMAAHMKRIGVGTPGIRDHIPKIMEELGKLAAGENWWAYASMAANMAELEILKPKTQTPEPNFPAPPTTKTQ